MRILIVMGTRPEAIKMAPLIRELSARPHAFSRVAVCLTGQHRELIEPVMSLFELPAHYNLNLMRPRQTIYDVTCAVLLGVRNIIGEEKPDMVLYHGDTTTAFAAALACFYEKVTSGHVEAGLRTRDKWRPFPEEMNRRMIDDMCDWRYAPTEEARENMLFERISPRRILVTGNTVVDALRHIASMPQHFEDAALKSMGTKRPMILVTAHRRESFGGAMNGITAALMEIARRNPGVDILFPVHPNPNVRAAVEPLRGLPGLHLVEPVDYLQFIHLLKRARLALSDSGGIQEEAPSLGVPLLVMRDVTERPEAVEAGLAKLVGTNPDRIVAEVEELLRNDAAHDAMTGQPSPYGDGRAAIRIADHMETLVKKK